MSNLFQRLVFILVFINTIGIEPIHEIQQKGRSKDHQHIFKRSDFHLFRFRKYEIFSIHTNRFYSIVGIHIFF